MVEYAVPDDLVEVISRYTHVVPSSNEERDEFMSAYLTQSKAGYICKNELLCLAWSDQFNCFEFRTQFTSHKENDE